MRDELIELVLAGTKTATCTDLWSWEEEQDNPIEPGMLTLAAGWIRQTTMHHRNSQGRTDHLRACDRRLRQSGGEHDPPDLPDDLVLENWRKYHWAYYSRVLPAIGRVPALDMPVLCEHFKVVYSEEMPSRS